VICGKTTTSNHEWKEPVYGTYEGVTGYKYTCAGCPESVVQKVASQPNLFVSPVKIDASQHYNIQGSKVMIESGNAFVRADGSTTDPVGYNLIYQATADGANALATGQYIIVKYRVVEPENNETYIKFWVDTIGNVPSEANSIQPVLNINTDGDWHVMVIDLASFASNNGKGSNFAKVGDAYRARYLRIDIGNVDSTVDFAYVAMCDNYAEACALDDDFELYEAQGQSLAD
jgi:hypothetical protein